MKKKDKFKKKAVDLERVARITRDLEEFLQTNETVQKLWKQILKKNEVLKMKNRKDRKSKDVYGKLRPCINSMEKDAKAGKQSENFQVKN